MAPMTLHPTSELIEEVIAKKRDLWMIEMCGGTNEYKFHNKYMTQKELEKKRLR
jgi:hypothetical protein